MDSEIVEVMIKGIRQLYVPKGIPIPTIIQVDNLIWHVSSLSSIMKLELESANDIRAIIVRGFPWIKHAYIFYIYWYKGADIENIDQKAREGKFESTDALNTVIVKYQKTCCWDGCQRCWHTLVVPTFGSFLSNPSSLNLENLSDLKILTCPQCGSDFRQLVVKIYGEADSIP